MIDPQGNGPRGFFQRVPESQAVKNRVHLDVCVGADLTGAARRGRLIEEVGRLLEMGAEQVRSVDEMGEHWLVMRDPEGNEFCVT